jgi:GAF domain-containing protein
MPQESHADLEEKLARTQRELSEALEQQAATAEVLRVISSSPGALEPVFRATLANAVRICEATFGTLYLREADAFRMVATHNAPPAFVEARQCDPLIRPPPDSALGRVAITMQVAHIADIKTIPSYLDGHPFFVAAVELAGYRTVLAVPMLKDNELIGAITINRTEVRPFTDKQIDLVTSFAAQAVIAIENTRLLNELQESLQQQTATSEVLSVISKSPGNLELVFQAMMENATRICEAKVGNLFLREGDVFRAVAVHGESDYADWFRREPVVVMRDQPSSPLDRLTRTKQVIHIPDLRLDQSYLDGNRRIVSLVDSAGDRYYLVVDGRELLIGLSDVSLSSGAACCTASAEPSHVLKAIGLSDEAARASLRFGLIRGTTTADVDAVVDAVAGVVDALRR